MAVYEQAQAPKDQGLGTLEDGGGVHIQTVSFLNSRRPHTQTSAPTLPRPLLLPTEMQDLGDLGLKEAEGSSAIFSENLDLEAWGEGSHGGGSQGKA